MPEKQKWQVGQLSRGEKNADFGHLPDAQTQARAVLCAGRGVCEACL
jgi:hypothetical protein